MKSVHLVGVNEETGYGSVHDSVKSPDVSSATICSSSNYH